MIADINDGTIFAAFELSYTADMQPVMVSSIVA